MNKFGNELLEFLKQWWLGLTLLATAFGFYYNTQSLHPRLEDVEKQMAEAELVHRDLERKITENTNAINITVARLETSLTQISNDLNYIKQKLFK